MEYDKRLREAPSVKRMLFKGEGKSINFNPQCYNYEIQYNVFFWILCARFSFIFLEILKGYNVAGVN